jgi:uncharacterized RmlC-like cupin family protein
MLRVSKVEGWLTRQRVTESARPGLGDPGDCVIIQSASQLPAGQPPVPAAGLPGDRARPDRAGDEDCRRSGGEQRSGGSGPSSGSQALRLHLVMIAPGTRGTPHLHPSHGTAVYVVSGEAEVWHGAGLRTCSAVRAGDFVYIPPGAPHLAVNRGDVTAIAVVARTGPRDQTGAAVAELPRHLAGLLSIPVGVDE